MKIPLPPSLKILFLAMGLLSPAPAQTEVANLLNNLRGMGDLPGTAEDEEVYAYNITTWQMPLGGFSKDREEDYLNPWDGDASLSVTSSNGTPLGMIDNDATVAEIRFLSEVYKTSGNPANRTAFKTSVNRALEYLLTAQYPSGGWPQMYPERSGTTYSNQVTYNDNAMVRVMVLFQDIIGGRTPFDGDIVETDLIPDMETALNAAIDYTLEAQIINDGELTVWCAQHDSVTLEPVGARSYELPSKSGSESVGIVAFLMNLPQPTPEIVNAVRGALAWFEKNKVEGLRFSDGSFVESPGSVMWYRFYNVEDDTPFFSGRDGIKKFDITEIEMERRTGYSWGGNYAENLLEAAPFYIDPTVILPGNHKSQYPPMLRWRGGKLLLLNGPPGPATLYLYDEVGRLQLKQGIISGGRETPLDFLEKGRALWPNLYPLLIEE